MRPVHDGAIVSTAAVAQLETLHGADRTVDQAASESRTRRLTSKLPLILLAALVLGLVGANLWWLDVFRRGLPYSIDESGYLQRSVLFGQDLSNHGIPGVFSFWTRPDTVGPLLPAFSGTIRAATGLSAFGLLCTQQIVYALTIVASYLLARLMAGRMWALVCAAVVACMPGLIDAGRLFLLAEPAVAMFTLLVVAQLRAGRFESLGRSLVWGLAVGLTALSRTMMLGVLIGPLSIAGLHWVGGRPSRRQGLNFASGLVVAFLVAGSWYWNSWNAVYSYLTQYGYGAAARNYGAGRSLISWGWWLVRLNNLVNQDLYFPLVCVLLLALLALLLQPGRITRRLARFRRAVNANSTIRSERLGLPTALSPESSPSGRVVAALNRVAQNLDRPTVQITAIIVISYLALSTSQNSGSYFELPLAPALICLFVAPVGRLHVSVRSVVAASAITAAALAGFDQFGKFNVLARNQSVDVGPAHMVAFNASNYRLIGQSLRGVAGSIAGAFWTNCGRATITCFYGRQTNIFVPYLRSWPGLNDSLEHFLYAYSARFDRTPVVFFAYQGPFLNTNSVQLAAQVQGRFLSVGVLLPPQLRSGVGLRQQLEDPRFGQPNFVLAGVPLQKGESARPGSSMKSLERVQQALATDGFQRVKTIRLPSAEALGIWWKDR